MSTVDRKKEVLDVCLKTFISHGLSETSVRDLSNSLNLQAAGIYWYFEDKDAAVVACAEEAANRLEHALLALTLKDAENPEKLIRSLIKHADDSRAMLIFYTSVCNLSKYAAKMKPSMIALADRYEQYVSAFAKKYEASYEEVAPYIGMAISAAVNYMILGIEGKNPPQLEIVKNALRGFIAARDAKK